jgi:DNA-directed RNA polymerase subunit RPC12/RpoP
MFRCDNCGSGYSSQAASSWTSCPRCLAKERIQVPLAFELGWHEERKEQQQSAVAGEQAQEPQTAAR